MNKGQVDKGVANSASRSQRTECHNNLGGREHLHLNLAAAGVLLALASVVLLLRFKSLGEIPPGLAFDEGVHGELALKVLQGEHAVYFPVDYGRQAWAPYVLAISTYFAGRTLLAMHLPTALGQCWYRICRILVGTYLLWKRRKWARYTLARPAYWRGRGRAARSIDRPNGRWTIVLQRTHLHVSPACRVSGSALAGMDETEPVAHCTGRGMFWAAFVHICCGVCHADSVSNVWRQSSVAFGFRHIGKSPS